MKKKVFYNMFLTVGIFVSVILGKKSFDDKDYWILSICIVAIFFFVWKKIELTKEMRANFKKQESDKKQNN